MIKRHEVADLNTYEFLHNYISLNELVYLVVYMDLINDVMFRYAVRAITETIEDNMNDYTLDELKKLVQAWRNGMSVQNK
jgi:hypothetical protein